MALRPYKLQGGATNYLEVLKIPMEDRLMGLVEAVGYEWVYTNLTAAITVAMETMNLSKPMSANQIAELSEEILDTASEDALSLEDVLLFLQKLVRGESGETYSRMDIPTFMKMFERHRQQRFRALKEHENEKNVYFKSLGPGRDGGATLKRDEDAGSILGLMQTYYDGNKGD